MSAPPRIGLIGDGKMARAIAQLAAERGIEVAAMLGAAENERGSAIEKGGLGAADVAIEFTEPSSAPANIRACLSVGVPVVVGTTGWLDQLPALERETASAGGAMLWAANFSIGVNLFLRLARAAGAVLAAGPGFDVHLVETHHSAKKDAPSGTALAIGREVAAGLGREVPITSVRTGHVPGTHEVIFDAPFEQITLAHVARDRRVFADGALRAAEWLAARPGGARRQGVFTMQDVLSGEGQAP
jgi:4-hydroxy-tetrahydrodipicolinate reductase